MPTNPPILLIEDEVLIAMAMCDELGEAGYDVRPAYYFDDATQIIASGKFQAAVLDFDLRADPHPASPTLLLRQADVSGRIFTDTDRFARSARRDAAFKTHARAYPLGWDLNFKCATTALVSGKRLTG